MNFSRPGAIDLSALRQPPARPATAGAAAPGAYVVDINEQNFQTAALEASLQYVVVLSLWSPRSPQSAAFNELLGTVTATYEGQIVLAQVDIDANPAIAQALEAKAVPLVVGLIKGQPVPLFQGTVDEAEIRRYFTELVAVATQNGLTGRAAPAVTEGRSRVRSPRLRTIRGLPTPTPRLPPVILRPQWLSTRRCSLSTRPMPRSPNGWQASS